MIISLPRYISPSLNESNHCTQVYTIKESNLELSNDHGLRDDDDAIVLLVVQQVLDSAIGLQHLHAASVLVQVVDDSGHRSCVAVQVLGVSEASSNQA